MEVGGSGPGLGERELSGVRGRAGAPALLLMTGWPPQPWRTWPRRTLLWSCSAEAPAPGPGVPGQPPSWVWGQLSHTSALPDLPTCPRPPQGPGCWSLPARAASFPFSNSSPSPGRHSAGRGHPENSPQSTPWPPWGLSVSGRSWDSPCAARAFLQGGLRAASSWVWAGGWEAQGRPMPSGQSQAEKSTS